MYYPQLKFHSMGGNATVNLGGHFPLAEVKVIGTENGQSLIEVAFCKYSYYGIFVPVSDHRAVPTVDDALLSTLNALAMKIAAELFPLMGSSAEIMLGDFMSALMVKYGCRFNCSSAWAWRDFGERVCLDSIVYDTPQASYKKHGSVKGDFWKVC